MSQQASYEIAQPWAESYRINLPVVPVELRLRGRELSRNLARWSG
jgi:hypothetical protein